MEARLYRLTVFALYQLTLFAGICLLPLALVARKIGLTVPLHRAVLRLEEAYDRNSAN